MHRAHISTKILIQVFSLQHRASRLDSILFTLPTFYVIFILFPTPYLPRFCLVFSSIFITEFQLELYGIFSRCSQHLSKLGSYIFILSQSHQRLFPVLLRVQKYSLLHVLSSNVKPTMGSNFHTVHPCQPQQRLILCTPHQLINCMPRKCISAIL